MWHCSNDYTNINSSYSQKPYVVGTIIILLKGLETDVEKLNNFPRITELVMGQPICKTS